MKRLFVILLSLCMMGCADENGTPSPYSESQESQPNDSFNFQQLKDHLLFSEIQGNRTSSIANTNFTSLENGNNSTLQGNNYFTLDGQTYSFPYVYCYSLGDFSEENIDIGTSYDIYEGISIPIKDIYLYTGEVFAMSVQVYHNDNIANQAFFGSFYLSNEDVEPLNLYNAYSPTIKIDRNKIEIKGDFIEQQLYEDLRNVNPTNVKNYYGEGSLTCNSEIDF